MLSSIALLDDDLLQPKRPFGFNAGDDVFSKNLIVLFMVNFGNDLCF